MTEVSYIYIYITQEAYFKCVLVPGAAAYIIQGLVTSMSRMGRAPNSARSGPRTARKLRLDKN